MTDDKKDRKPLEDASLWAIKGRWADGSGQFFYTGVYPLRRTAIAAHVAAVGGTWRQAYRLGDRAVRVTIREWGIYAR